MAKKRLKEGKMIKLEEIFVAPGTMSRQSLVELVEKGGIEAAEPQLQELMASMKSKGQIECIGVSDMGLDAGLLKEDGLDAMYQLMFGLRRVLAARLLGWDTIKAVILK